MDIYLAAGLTVLYWIVYPIYLVLYYIALTIFYILAPIARVILFIFQPLFFFGGLVISGITAPFYFLARFETIYIYLGVAGLTGLTTGLLLHFFYDFLYSTMKLAPDAPVRGPTVSQYRESRRKKAKLEHDRDPTLSSASLSLAVSDTPGRGRQGLLAQTIHEEDSDF